VTFTELIIEDALINEVTNQRRLLTAAVVNNNDSEAQKIRARIYDLKNQIKNIKEDRNMKTLEERTSKELKAIAKREGVPNWWTLNKAKLIEGIKAKQAEAEERENALDQEFQDREIESENEAFMSEITEAHFEAPTEPIEETSEAPKENAKTEPKRANKKLTELTYNGETKSIREWAEKINMPWPTLYDRVNRNGWSIEDAIETPLGQRRPK
jgi:hypothetical protein